MRCCSLAVFICANGKYTYCTPCHNDAMAKNNSKVFSQCTGGPNCPLGIPEHPKASNDQTSCFPIGCSICRCKKLELISNNNDAKAGVNLEVRKDMIELYGNVKGHEIFENEK